MPDKEGMMIKNLEFSLDSSLLGVHCENGEREQIMVFVRSNWKWYCKQVIILEGRLAVFKWMFNKK